MERRQVEAHMIGRRHAHDAAGADIAFGLLDLVANLRRVGALGALHRLYEDRQAVIGMTAEGRDRLPGLLLVGAGIIYDHWLLRIASRKLVGNEQRRCRQPYAFGRWAGEIDKLLRGHAVALVERQRDSELAKIAGDDRWTLAEAWINHRLHARLVFDIGELRGHIAVARPITLLDRDHDAGLGRDRDALVAHRLAERVGARNQRDRRQLASLEIGKDLLARHLIGVRRLEDPRADRLDDLNGAGQ